LERISPTNDLAMKKVLASEENKDILSGLIHDFFGVVAEDITIINPYSIEAFKEFSENNENITVLRQTLRDITATFKAADFVSEVQVRKTRYFDERSVYYPLKRFCDNYNVAGSMEVGADGKANRYSSLRTVYALNILGYANYPSDNDSLRIFELYDPVRNKRPNKQLFKIGYFELTKSEVETANQKHWRDYFLTGEVGSEAPEYIKKASRVIETVNLGEEEKKVIQALEKAQAIIDAEYSSAFFDGKDEGAEQERVKWQSVVADKDTQIADKDALIAELLARLNEK